MTTANDPVSLGEFGAYPASKDYTPPTDPAVLAKLKKWQDDKIGLLITWGPYSQWGIVESWSLITTRHTWNQRPAPYAELSDREYVRAYENLRTTFNPVQFDPDRWAAAIKDAGIRYVLPMAKHHDGFCMYDTATTDYRITAADCPFSRNPRADVTKALCEAFRKQGLSVGLYFSKVDWHCPDYWLPSLPPGRGQGANYTPADHPDHWKRFKDFTWAQIRELMSKYGPQDILWLDGGAVSPPKEDIDMSGMAAMAREYQPGLIVVDRTVKGPNENYVTPEQEIPDRYLPFPWETCMTLGTSWSYKPNETYKSTGTLVRNLCRIVARGGNYLLGAAVGPEGTLDEAVYGRFQELGAWLKVNGEAIYGTRPIPPYEQGECVFTCKADGTMYAIILSQDDSGTLPEQVELPAERSAQTRRTTLLGFGEIGPGEWGDGRRTIRIPEAVRTNPPGAHAWTLKLEN